MPVFSHVRQTLVTLVLLVAICFTARLWVQKDAGTLVGTVRHATGAVVPGAKVTVEDVDRGVQMTPSSNDQGEYPASPLPIGSYQGCRGEDRVQKGGVTLEAGANS